MSGDWEEEITSKMHAMEAVITGKIRTFGDHIIELIINRTDKQMKSMKEEMALLREELKENSQELRKLTKICQMRNMKNNDEGKKQECGDSGESPDLEVMASDTLEITEQEELNEEALDNVKVVVPKGTDHIPKGVMTALCKEEALRDKGEEEAAGINADDTEKKSTENESQKKTSSPPLSPPFESLPENIRKEQVHRLVQSHLDIDPVNEAIGEVPLTCAVLFGNIHEVRKLLESGANIRMRDAWDLNALHYASVCGFTDIAKVLLEEAKELVATRASIKDYCTPLHLAAEKGQTPVSDVLITAGVDVCAKNTQGLTALHIAAMEGHTDLVNLLLSKGADVMSTDKEEQCALHLAAKGGHIDVVNALLDKNSDVRSENFEQQTALHLAASEGHLPVVEILFYRGSEIESLDSSDYSPLHYAAANGHTDIVKFLLSKNADVTLVSTDDETALCCAAKNGHEETVKALIAKGIELTMSDQNALMALDLAASEGHSWVVYSLLKATENLLGPPGKEAVCTAVDNNYVNALQALIQEGVNPNAKGSDKCHAIAKALQNNYTECVMILENAGAVKPTQNAGAVEPTQNAGYGSRYGYR